jgi:hypothetical protein
VAIVMIRRLTVSDTALMAATAIKATPQAAHPTIPAVIRTGVLWPVSASDQAGAATNANAAHVTRVHHTRIVLTVTRSACRVDCGANDS